MRVKSMVVVLLSAVMLITCGILSDPGDATAAQANVVITGKADGVYTLPSAPLAPVPFFDADFTLTLTPNGSQLLPQSYSGVVKVLNGFADQADTIAANINFSDAVTDPLYVGYTLLHDTLSVGILNTTGSGLTSYGFFVPPGSLTLVPLTTPFDILDIPGLLRGPNYTQALPTWAFADALGNIFGTPMGGTTDLQIFALTNVNLQIPPLYLVAAQAWDLTH